MESVEKRRDLIFDVGMHKGEDSDYYLRKGFRVVGIEADPDLAAHCRKRFLNEISSGRMTIIEGAIVDMRSSDKKFVRFYRSKVNSVLGTVVDDWMHRNESSDAADEIISVPAVDIAQCYRDYGVPHYLKIDIEGMDAVCLKALLDFDQRPDYISIESERAEFDKLSDELVLFLKLGFTEFKAVQQANVASQKEPLKSAEGRCVGHLFQVGCSGLFGSDLPGKWRTHEQILSEYKLIFFFYGIFGDNGWLKDRPGNKKIKRVLETLFSRRIPGWYDLHAKHNSVV